MKIITVTSCLTCPLSDVYRADVLCTQAKRRRPVEYAQRQPIPSWCPLEDGPRQAELPAEEGGPLW